MTWDRSRFWTRATWSAHEGGVSCCAFSPDGSRVVSASPDGTLELWDPASGRCIGTWREHQGFVTSCSFSPDGRTVISSGSDGLYFWDVATGRTFRKHYMASGAYAVLDSINEEVLEASEGAWRWLVWQLFDAEGRLVDVVPGETFGALPAPKLLGQ